MRGINDDDDRDDTHEIDDCKAVGETDKALRVETPNGQVWIPKSVCHDDSEILAKGHEGRLVVQRWFAVKQGWT